jgi:hypothetical protein
MMTIMKFLTAAATVAVLSVAGAASASADSWYGHDGYDSNGYGYQDNRGDYNDQYRSDYDRDGDHNNGWHRGWYGHDGWRNRHAHYYGRPFWYYGRYVVRSYDNFGRVTFIEVGRNGGVSGYVRF